MSCSGIPSTPAILIVVALVVTFSVTVTTFVGNSLTLFVSKVPVYRNAFQSEVSHVHDKWDDFVRKSFPDRRETEKAKPDTTSPAARAAGADQSAPGGKPTLNGETTPAGQTTPDDKTTATDKPQQKPEQLESELDKALNNLVDIGFVLRLVADTTSSALSALSNLAIIILIMIFMLFEAEGLPRKIRGAIERPDADLANYLEVGDKVYSYVLIKTVMSFVTAALVCLLLTATGVEFPVLLALIVFLFNYIPTIGSFIAAIPAIVLSLFSIDGEIVTLMPGTAIIVGIGYLAINIVIGNVIEPRVMGKSLGLSPLVIILSLMFWSWILGPVGMLLSVPLTMVLKIIFDNSHDFRALGVLLGPSDESLAKS